ncbi:YlbF family regulator [Tumebacillus sp. ITR2]|uniref:YlbF family regulator n=1 Tax=Tumebacillus amylolyticus TaxID=2801339 RepID=A0ABS1J923_9BACL|nr:YlbF family regulator [Tumebacillus amylolyticus]MBL0386776.1 YlbF family regulator [Tumebacillus amylolyticus]
MQTVDQRMTILDKAQQLAGLLAQSEEMQRFRQAENKINRHADAQALMFVVRAKRNAYSQTSLRHGYEHPATEKAKAEYDDVLNRIAQIPLIDEYKEAQDEVNDIVQGVLQTIVNTLSSDVPVEKSEDPGESSSGGGCGSCGSAGGCGRH